MHKDKKRKLILLNRDHTVTMTKQTIAELKKARKLIQAKWIMIPIQHTGASYMGVDCDTILTRDFDVCRIYFHMNMKALSRSETNDLEEETLYSYYPTEIEAYTVEELYNAVYNIMAFRYVKELFGNSDSPDDFWFLDVDELAVEYVKDGNVTKSFHIDACDFDVPFAYNAIDEVADKVSKFFGLIKGNPGETIPNIYVSNQSGQKEWKWLKPFQSVELYSYITGIFVSNPIAKSFIYMNTKRYDAALRMTNAMSYATVINDAMTTKQLPIAADFKLPKYHLRDYMYGCDAGVLEEYYGEHEISTIYRDKISNIFTLELTDAEDIMIFIDNLHFYMQVYLEGAKVNAYLNSEDPSKSFQGMQLDATVLINMIIDVESPNGVPCENQLIIYTDPYEDNQPNMVEVGTLLKAQGSACQ